MPLEFRTMRPVKLGIVGMGSGKGGQTGHLPSVFIGASQSVPQFYFAHLKYFQARVEGDQEGIAKN